MDSKFSWRTPWDIYQPTIEANERSYFTSVLEQTHGKLYGSDSACADLLPLAKRAHTG